MSLPMPPFRAGLRISVGVRRSGRAGRRIRDIMTSTQEAT